MALGCLGFAVILGLPLLGLELGVYGLDVGSYCRDHNLLAFATKCSHKQTTRFRDGAFLELLRACSLGVVEGPMRLRLNTKVCHVSECIRAGKVCFQVC